MTSDPLLSSLEVEIRRLCQQIDERGKEYWWVKAEIATMFERYGYHLLPRHFYTPIPDPETAAGTDFNKETFPITKLHFNETEALTFLDGVRDRASELIGQFPAMEPSGSDYYWKNPFFTGLDAASLFTMIRSLRPRKVIEIGSGFSTHIALRALELNGQGSLTCMEPYPTPKLLELSGRIEILQRGVQTAPRDAFSSLSSGDILFIDSSHVSCMGSDVNFEILEILPNLAQGVVVHLHDIFLPFEYPREWVVDRRWYWNEQYLLYAFLRMNESFEVWMPNLYMTRRHNKKVAEAIPFLDSGSQSGVSFWMRKTR